MLKALDRIIAAASERIVLVAPSVASVSDVFQNVDVNGDRARALVREAQQLRGSIYLRDGAIGQHQLTEDGRHQTAEDDRCWHVLLLDRDERVTGCAQYFEHKPDVRFEETRAVSCPLLREPGWRQTVWRAMEAELRRARRARLRYAEVGGWAVCDKTRNTAGPLALPLAVWALSRRNGGVFAMTTATFRHCSSTILQRLGGSPFEIDNVTVPPYFDDRYGCMMEMIRFDSRNPNPKYLGLISQIENSLSKMLVVARTSAVNVVPASRMARATSRRQPALVDALAS